MRDDATDAERFPHLTPHGRAMLEFLREHPHAPLYRNRSGHRLERHDIDELRRREREVATAAIDWQPNVPPSWCASFVEQCRASVPYYRAYEACASFTALPTLSRADLVDAVPYLVPDDVEIARLINFRTSGTTGHPLLIASHPLVAAQYLLFHKRALARFGVMLQHGRGQVGVVLLGWQSTCFTYVSVTPLMDESGLAKINLHPNDWRDPTDRAKYLEALQPEVLAGDPLSYEELLAIDPKLRPAALLSTSMALSPALSCALTQRFGAPVLDLYSMNEAGPVAVFDPRVGGHVLLQPGMYVEILDPEGQPVPVGQRGEIVLTGGFNFCLPLLRYRTGDYAALEAVGDDRVLRDLEGRPPVRYRRSDGTWINNIEVTHALRPLPLSQFTVHQFVDGRIAVKYAAAAVDAGTVLTAMKAVFGPQAIVTVEQVARVDGKVVQYTSALVETTA